MAIIWQKLDLNLRIPAKKDYPGCVFRGRPLRRLSQAINTSKLAGTNQEGNWVAVKFKKGESGFFSERVFLKFFVPPPEVMAGVFITLGLAPKGKSVFSS